jgi:hypothetical protein
MTTKPFTPELPPCDAIDEDSNSNVNPPTDQKLAIGVEVLKSQGVAAIVTAVPEATDPKAPVFPFTTGLIQEVTSVAEPGDELLTVSKPVNPILPVTGIARTCVAASNNVTAPAK